MTRVLLIDVYNYIHRAYHALPKTFKDKDGHPTNAVYGFASMLINSVEILKPTHVIACFDDPFVDVFRKSQFEDYKAHRKESDQDLIVQVPKIKELLTAFGVISFVSPGYEADDIIGTIAVKAKVKGYDVLIVSNDRDVLQLLDPRIRVFIPDSSKEGGRMFGPSEFKEKYGLEPLQMIDFKALRGDASDNIPGVKGIGEVTATALLKEFGDLDTIYKNLANVRPVTVQNKLTTYKDDAYMSRDLATIITEVPLELVWEDCRFKGVRVESAVEFLKGYNFKSLLKRIGFDPEGNQLVTEAPDKSQLSLI